MKKLIGKCGPCPVFASYTLAFALQLRKRHGKTSARVVSRATQAHSVQKKNKHNTITEYNTITKYNTITCTIQENEQYNTQKKNSNTEQYDVTEQKRTQNKTDRKQLQVIKLFVK
jgi:hypothetical protein